jgi:Ser/Thr protein kinase RdoA (MazF antagonist)
MNNFQKRINYQGDLNPILQNVCRDFDIGKYASYEMVPIGYEDFNLFVRTDKGKYFVKVFGAFRDKRECSRYVEIIEGVLKAGVSHPKLYKSTQGYLYEASNGSLTDRLVVMQYIDGKIFYELQTTPTAQDMRFVIKQAALINTIPIKPPPVYDHWAITSFLKEYEEKGRYLPGGDKNFIEPLVEIFNSLSIEHLPHCFVHGDITKTNTMKSTTGNIFILDFAVANYYPRIQELAVILCDLFFNPDNPQTFPENYDLAVREYRKYISLTDDELDKLPGYIRLAHAMHVLLANYEKVVNKNTSDENEYFLRMGRIGLTYTNSFTHLRGA